MSAAEAPLDLAELRKRWEQGGLPAADVHRLQRLAGTEHTGPPDVAELLDLAADAEERDTMDWDLALGGGR